MTNSDLAVALRAASRASVIGLDFFQRFAELDQRSKADGSPVTDADVAVETAIRSTLQVARPDDAITGEETGSTGSGQRRWILDGIDATLAFINGDPRWQTLIALEVDGVIEVGVAVLPATGEIFYAQRGRGAFLDAIDDGKILDRPQRLQAGTATELTQATVTVLPPVPFLSATERSTVQPFLDQTAPIDPSRHGALLVATGELDVCVEVDGEEWDYAALEVIVHEAGAVFGTVDSASAPMRGVGIFATSTQLLETTRSILASI